VNQPQGILGPISTIPHAGKLNALITLNLRPQTREAWGFDARKARSITDATDDGSDMPDALEIAARMDAKFARTRKLAGPLHGVVMAIKDQYDTVDIRTTAGADAFWANDRPPDDATFVKRLRNAGAIILAKANMGEYAAGGTTGTRSSFGGKMCNAYDTERDRRSMIAARTEHCCSPSPRRFPSGSTSWACRSASRSCSRSPRSTNRRPVTALRRRISDRLTPGASRSVGPAEANRARCRSRAGSARTRGARSTRNERKARWSIHPSTSVASRSAIATDPRPVAIAERLATLVLG